MTNTLLERIAAALEDIAENGRRSNELSAEHFAQNRKQNALTKAWFRFSAERDGHEPVELVEGGEGSAREYYRFMPVQSETVEERARRNARTQRVYDETYTEEMLRIRREREDAEFELRQKAQRGR